MKRRLTEDQIAEINSKSPMDWQTNEQGIFTEPFGIPSHIKDPVIYMRYETGGVSGGSCWDSSNPQRYFLGTPEPQFECLNLVLKELCPQLTFLQYQELVKLIQSNEKTEWEYYGNRTDFTIKFIVLEDLYELIEQLT